MIKANEALSGSIDKHSFVSLIYGIVETGSATLTLARAGHCPMLLVGNDRVEYVRPTGMGVGLSGGLVFEGAIEERTISLREGDVCVFYTDGITEARFGMTSSAMNDCSRSRSGRVLRLQPASVGTFSTL